MGILNIPPLYNPTAPSLPDQNGEREGLVPWLVTNSADMEIYTGMKIEKRLKGSVIRSTGIKGYRDG